MSVKEDSKLNLFLISVLYFVLGIVFFASTEELVRTFNFILVCICLVIGVIQLISFLVNKKYVKNDFSDLLVAMVFFWVSLILYVYYGFTINILPILFSLYLFIVFYNMIIRYCNATSNKKRYLILGILALIVGVLLIFNPGGMVLIYLKVTGIYLIVVGIMFFIEFIKTFKITKN